MIGPNVPLTLIDGLRLDESVRSLLRPGELLPDRRGRARRLPRFFYEVPTWRAALELQLTPHFALWEFLDVDVREASRMRSFPRYIPCGVTLLATALEAFRQEVGTFVHIAANGGYRSPAHALCRHASTHAWGTAANIYRVGDVYLDNRDELERFSRVAARLLPGVWTGPYGDAVEQADDHLHLDLGYACVTPHNAPGEDPGGSSPGANPWNGEERTG